MSYASDHVLVLATLCRSATDLCSVRLAQVSPFRWQTTGPKVAFAELSPHAKGPDIVSQEPRWPPGFSTLKIGACLACTPRDTLLLALAGGCVDGPVFCVLNKSVDAVLAPCARRVNSWPNEDDMHDGDALGRRARGHQLQPLQG